MSVGVSGRTRSHFALPLSRNRDTKLPLLGALLGGGPASLELPALDFLRLKRRMPAKPGFFCEGVVPAAAGDGTMGVLGALFSDMPACGDIGARCEACC